MSKRKKVAFFTSAHQALDDRIFYYMGNTLKEHCDILIVSTCNTLSAELNGILINSSQAHNTSRLGKVQFFFDQAVSFNPDIIICSEPLPILAGSKYRTKINGSCKIIYDVTEYYPSIKNLIHTSPIQKVFKRFGMTFFNIYAASKVSGFIFGEYHKSLLYRRLFPRKKHIFISYYPDLHYIEKQTIGLHFPICLGFTGKLTNEKGLFNFARVALELSKVTPEIKLKLIGWFADKEEEDAFFDMVKTIETEYVSSVPFTDFAEQLRGVHFLFDLREPSRENRHALPIKLYFYAACGKPMFYSDNVAIKKAHPPQSFLHLVDPEDPIGIVDIIKKYLSNEFSYSENANLAREFSEKKYNWSILKDDFIRFIQTI